jgi:GNAT superfamily N-acetyltransferase
MSAEALNPRQFGPGGKYTTQPSSGGWNSIEAVHTKSGRRIGAMSWFPGSKEGIRHVQGSPDPSKPGIFKVSVSKPQQRKGVATAMLEHARDIAPGLQHSGPQALSEEGAAWAKARP